jgi:outer membrane murein-binding lipoprotein Lpp
MKAFILIIGAAILAAGCSHKPDERDAKITKLESRVSELDARCEKLNEDFTNLASSDSQFLTKTAALIQEGMEEENAKYGVLLAAITNSPQKPAATRPNFPVQPQASAYATKDGVPVAVYNQIAAEAAQKFPTDYDMQVFRIKEQVEAYRALHQ